MDKVVLFIVEGATDKRALASIFRKIYRNRTVRFEFTHGDITSDETISIKNVEDEIYKYVKSYIDISKIKKVISGKLFKYLTWTEPMQTILGL